MPSTAAPLRPRRKGARRDAVPQKIVNGLRRVVRAIELYSQEVLKEYGLTGPQLWALKTLQQHGSLTTTTLAKALAVQPSSLSILINRLEARGLVRRIRRASDRRYVELTLTARGQALTTRAPEPAQGRLLHGLARLPARRQREILEAVTDLVGMMEAGEVNVRFFFSDD